MTAGMATPAKSGWQALPPPPASKGEGLLVETAWQVAFSVDLVAGHALRHVGRSQLTRDIRQHGYLGPSLRGGLCVLAPLLVFHLLPGVTLVHYGVLAASMMGLCLIVADVLRPPKRPPLPIPATSKAAKFPSNDAIIAPGHVGLDVPSDSSISLASRRSTPPPTVTLTETGTYRRQGSLTFARSSSQRLQRSPSGGPATTLPPTSWAAGPGVVPPQSAPDLLGVASDPPDIHHRHSDPAIVYDPKPKRRNSLAALFGREKTGLPNDLPDIIGEGVVYTGQRKKSLGTIVADAFQRTGSIKGDRPARKSSNGFARRSTAQEETVAPRGSDNSRFAASFSRAKSSQAG